MAHDIGKPARGGARPSGLAIAAPAVLLLSVVLHMSAFGFSEAAPDLGTRTRVSMSSRGPQTKSLVASAGAAPPPPQLPVAATYRPPIINFNYMGGPILWKPIHLYFVWYGTWTEAEKNVVRTASNSLTPKKRIRQFPNLSGLWKVVRKYYQEPQNAGEKRKYASNDVSIQGEVNDDYSFGYTIDGITDPRKIIVSHLGHGLPIDLEQGVYFLFTSADVSFGNALFCGFHSYECVTQANCDPAVDDSIKIIYSFVPIPSDANGLINSFCNSFETPAFPGVGIKGLPPNYEISPNGALDSMIVTYLHELLELAVDPKVFVKYAWIMNLNENSETADLCSTDYVAGDWYYCDTPSLYPDFPANGVCTSIFDNYAALTEPKSHTAFNLYGIDGSRFLAQMQWSLDTKGCATQPEAACPRKCVVLRESEGIIQRGHFFKGVGLQTYAPGQDCTWEIHVRGARCIRITFETVALGFDDLDFVTVSHANVIKKKVTGFGKDIKVKIAGDKATVHFVTFGERSPYPSSAGFIMRYEARQYC